MSFKINNVAEHTQNSFASFRRFREEGVLCDVILEAISEQSDVYRLYAHKVVLAAEIPYFRFMFEANTGESTQNLIPINGIQGDILQAIVSYAYGEEVDLPKDRICFLLVAADMFQMLSLRQKCFMCLQSSLQPDQCLEVGAVAELHNCPELFEACITYARTNFERVTEDFLSLSSHNLIYLISSDRVLVTKEEQVYTAVLKWVYHDLEGRKEVFPEIMGHVRLPFTSLDFLNKVVQQEPLVQDNIRCINYLKEAYDYKNPRAVCALQGDSPRLKPRKLPGVEDMFITVGGMFMDYEYQTTMEMYDPVNNTWSIFGNIAEPIYGLCACYVNGYMYVVGGSINNTILNSLERYNIREKKWETMKPMKRFRIYHAVCVLYGFIYVTGGMTTDGSILSSTECYNPELSFWEELSPMTTSRMNHGMTDAGSKLFVVGGRDGPNVFGTAECYDPSVDVWTLVSSMFVPRHGLGVASLGSTVYAVGGEYSDHQVYDTVECYDIQNDVWNLCVPLRLPRSRMGLVKYQDTLYACGNSDIDGLETSVEKYNPTFTSWEFCASMEANKYYFGIICT